ncbi:MAG TPA: hypothetical protein VGQ99_14040 [Tepidisphaeraceae bacterium]|jgi:hypothetical protein|nr:hypothetical protein [Tepidisphaeraceae bacterium]
MPRLILILSLLCLIAADPPKDKPTSAPAREKEPWQAITDKEIASITYEDAEVDSGFVTPLAQDLSNLDDDSKKELDQFAEKLDNWVSGQEKDLVQQLRNWMCLCTFADLGRGLFEAEVPYVVFDRLKRDIPKEKLTRVLAYIILKPDEGKLVLKAPDLGFEEDAPEADVRERHVIYAKKLLGRLVGKLPPKDQ